jgi:plasmid stability protein
MANLSIKELPDGVHRELKKAAQAAGRSLNSYIVSLLELSVEERSRRRMMRKNRGEFRKFLASLPPLGDSVPLIREDREKGHR